MRNGAGRVRGDWRTDRMRSRRPAVALGLVTGPRVLVIYIGYFVLTFRGAPKRPIKNGSAKYVLGDTRAVVLRHVAWGLWRC